MGFIAFIGRLLEPFLSGLSFRAFIKEQIVWSILKALKVKSSMNESDFLKVGKEAIMQKFITGEVLNLLMDELLRKSIEEARKSPKLSVWSPKASAALRFLKKTTPEFSISREAAKLLEEAIKDRYPEIWKAVEEAMRE
jgi:hypothetical protein